MSTNYRAVRDEVDAACREAGRDPAEVTLIAVSKFHGLDRIREAMAEGCRDFGESRPQELRDKQNELHGAHWHFIGPLQRNKAKYVARAACLVHSLDDLRVAQELARRATGPLPVLAEANLSGADNKKGVPLDETVAFCEELMRLEPLELRGLMGMAPWLDDPEDTAPYFRALRELRDEGVRRGLPLTELSMGMSSDFRQAIREGSTLVRVGTAIFGSRGY